MPNETEELEKLIALYGHSLEGKIWRGSHAKRSINSHHSTINTGYKSINTQLHSNGWPLGTICEFGIMQHGIGELRLLIPALIEAQRSSQQKHVVLIAPPYLPFAPALAKEGIDLESLSIVRTKTVKDSLWAAEQSLIANCCAAVICWTGTHKINNHDLRRLQLAAEKTQSWSVLFRHANCLEEASVSGLRILLGCNSYGKLDLTILKQPHGWGGQKCTVSLRPHYENWQRIPVSLLPVHTANKNEVETINSKALIKQDGGTIAQPKKWNASVSVISSLSALRTVH